jgi:predicted SAM-dependent methyltransferase
MEERNTLRYINIGCGAHPFPGWKNYDHNIFIFFARINLLRSLLKNMNFIPVGFKEFMDIAASKKIKYADGGKHIPEANNTIDALYSSHMLEHLDEDETHVFLTESKRILKDGGIIRLVVPDFDILIRSYNHHNNPAEFIKDSCLVGQKPKSLIKKLQYLFQGHGWHFSMYNQKTLVALLARYEFKNIQILQEGETNISGCEQLNLSPHSHESIFIEAEK